jgi:hypothetical protein
MKLNRMTRCGFVMKAVAMIVTMGLCANALALDTIITKQNKKYQGKVVKNTAKGFVIQTTDGSMIILPKQDVTQIYRDNKLLDFEAGMSYYIDVKHPFLPLGILGIGAGIYAVNRFQAYQENQRETSATGEQNLSSSKTALALGIASTIVSLGSFYVALRPLEMKVPIGKIKMSVMPGSVRLALNF